MKQLVALLPFVLACGSTPRSTPSSSSSPSGSLIWIKRAVTDYRATGIPALPSRDPMERERLMVFDFAASTSRDLAEAFVRHVGTPAPSGDAVYLTDGMRATRVSKTDGRWRVDELGRMGRSGDHIDAVAPDGSSWVMFGPDGLCLFAPGEHTCIAIKLPFEWDVNSEVSYTSGNRLVVRVPTGKQDAVAVGMGMSVQIAVVDAASKTARRIEVPAIGYVATVSPDGRLAWIEQSGNKLLLATAPLDRLDAKMTFDLGPAEAQSWAECTFAGVRILCVVRNEMRLVSASTRDGSITTLEADHYVMPDSVVASSDGRWVAYQRIGDFGDAWLVTPIDRAAARPLPIDGGARVVAWLR